MKYTTNSILIILLLDYYTLFYMSEIEIITPESIHNRFTVSIKLYKRYK